MKQTQFDPEDSIIGMTITKVVQEDGGLYLHLNDDKLIIGIFPTIVGHYPALQVGTVNFRAHSLH